MPDKISSEMILFYESVLSQEQFHMVKKETYVSTSGTLQSSRSNRLKNKMTEQRTQRRGQSDNNKEKK